MDVPSTRAATADVAIWLATANAECVPQTVRSIGARVDLRKRLVERCQYVRLVPTARGRFRLDARARIMLDEQA